MKNVLVICGPTASGKTSLALSVARQIISNSSLRGAKRRGNLTPPPSVNILSADSRQIYKGLDIVTGKDIPQDLPTNINFFGLDLVEPNQVYNLADFVNYSQKMIQTSIKENVPLMIVGGTGLYLKAITSDLLNVHVPPNESLRHDLEKLDLLSLQSRLLALNPQKLESLNNSDKSNPRRLIRSIEIASYRPSVPTLGRHCEEVLRRGNLTPPIFHWIGLKPDSETLKLKIRQRVLNRLDSGALEEVKTLMHQYPDTHLPIYTSLGVREIRQYLLHEISRETLVDMWTASEIDYARRQMVWFKKQPGIVWYDKSAVDKSLSQQLAEIYTK